MSNDQSQVPGVTDKRVAPPGILPRNIQALVLGGLAVAIVIVFSGRSSPKRPSSTPPGAEPTVLQPDGDKVKDYRNRIDEEAKKLAKEQAELVRSKQAFAGAANKQMLLQGSGWPGVPSSGSPSANYQPTQEAP